ncbi:MAG: hypothetical protein J3Q66DRAFT_278308 [Benniella sp.]|nr:MAG: hypothetical protein J3Q66DRAFT_278308 [Benniella sp.]
MALVRHLRYKRINGLLKKYPDPTLPLRNLEVAREVQGALSELEFPFLNVVSLEFALFKTYAIPSISKILAATKEFTNNCLKRADDTAIVLLEINECYARNQRRIMTEGKVDEKELQNDTARQEIAFERLNFIHGQYNIKQEDYLYTLALFISEPGSFIGRFEWRPLTELELNEYERTHSQYAKTNRVVADATIDLLLSLAPSFTHGFGRIAVSALLTPMLREAFDLPPAPKVVTAIVYGALWARGTFIKYFMLPRRLPLVRTAARANKDGLYVLTYHKYKPVYPDGYRVEDLGPEKFIGKCPVSFHPSGITPRASEAAKEV